MNHLNFDLYFFQVYFQWSQIHVLGILVAFNMPFSPWFLFGETLHALRWSMTKTPAKVPLSLRAQRSDRWWLSIRPFGSDHLTWRIGASHDLDGIPWSLTVRPWKMLGWKMNVPFGARPICGKAYSFRVYVKLPGWYVFNNLFDGFRAGKHGVITSFFGSWRRQIISLNWMICRIFDSWIVFFLNVICWRIWYRGIHHH